MGLIWKKKFAYLPPPLADEQVTTAVLEPSPLNGQYPSFHVACAQSMLSFSLLLLLRLFLPFVDDDDDDVVVLMH